MSTETSDKTLSGIFYLLTVMCLLYGMTDIGESVFKNSIAPQEWLSSILNNYYDLIIIMGSLEHCYDPNKTLKISILKLFFC
mgnify:CR=1 FL=1